MSGRNEIRPTVGATKVATKGATQPPRPAAGLRWFAIAGLLALVADQLTKVWARRVLHPIYPQVLTVIPGYWDFRYSENRGAAFGLLRDLPAARLVFIVAALAISVGAALYLRRAQLRRPALVGLALGLVAGGAVGNAIDRLLFSRVTDFVVWKIGRHEWDTFNVADATLVVGFILLFLDGGAKRGDASGDRPAAA